MLNNLKVNSKTEGTSLGSFECGLKWNKGPVLLFVHGTHGLIAFEALSYAEGLTETDVENISASDFGF